ncbi:FAD-dependent oxidoreductase [Paenibacillus woosongensis]|uniref:Oxidoreductase n=1 Tax=Paenibacillus woosongensis TaxID=307580 RepID=A0A7X2Z522_9BACL|nr:FAD-dependent oxidoreductase [Paenibacillus woosongensis]MUG47679.1 oxidoreductase [Paenibacillus woosongensis]
MSFFQDHLIPFFQKREMKFIESYKESDEVNTFVFEKEKDLTWKAGQYGLFSITHKSVKNGTRPFSVSSAPTENAVRITTLIGKQPSEFKKALLELTPGMKVTMRGPVGPFYLKDENPALFIVGGIGITPFRSILKQIDSTPKEVGKPVHLLYMNGNREYLFKGELDEMANRTSISLTYLDSRDELHQEINKFSSLYKNSGKYYIAGPKSMVEAVSNYLLNNQVSKQNIKKDAFFGY